MSDRNNRTIWCGNLPSQITELILYELFMQAGELESVFIPRDGRSMVRNYAFITFRDETAVPFAMNILQGTRLFGKVLIMRPRGRTTPLNGHYPLENEGNIMSRPNRGSGGASSSRDDPGQSASRDNSGTYSPHGNHSERHNLEIPELDDEWSEQQNNGRPGQLEQEQAFLFRATSENGSHMEYSPPYEHYALNAAQHPASPEQRRNHPGRSLADMESWPFEPAPYAYGMYYSEGSSTQNFPQQERTSAEQRRNNSEPTRTQTTGSMTTGSRCTSQTQASSAVEQPRNSAQATNSRNTIQSSTISQSASQSATRDRTPERETNNPDSSTLQRNQDSGHRSSYRQRDERRRNRNGVSSEQSSRDRRDGRDNRGDGYDTLHRYFH